jgi:ABC-2 type transport system ATP-binding protein
MPPLLEIVQVRKRYASAEVLRGVSFQLAAGEFFGLLGPNGAGKTTLISILTGLATASGGEVRLDGQRFTPHDRRLRELIGLAPQELALYPDLTARENLRFFGELYGLRGATLADRVDETLAAIALTERADDRAGTFSGGMQRRLNLGLAVLHRPRLLILDEPTTGVDPQSRNHIFEDVRRRHAAGLTVLYTSHYMEEVQALCGRVGILDQGQLVACDTVPRLLQTLEARILGTVPDAAPSLAERLAQVPGAKVLRYAAGSFELASSDLAGTLVRLVQLLTELGTPPTQLETQSANLERVFLHLTGRALRD